jgi:hypothetical protein
MNERAGTYASSLTLERTSDAAAPAAIDVRMPIAKSSPKRTGRGIDGHAIAAASADAAALQATTSRRGRTRSTTADMSPPPSTYGRKPSANVSDASSGELVLRYTRIVSATAATLVPETETSWAPNSARNSREAKAAP